MMPELPEVEVIVRGLRENVEGLTIARIGINFPEIINGGNQREMHRLKGKRVNHISRKGKYILTEFSEGERMLTHLGMTGKLLVVSSGSELPKHSHVIIEFKENGRYLVFNDIRRFGRMVIDDDGGKIESIIDSLGADPLKISAEEFVDILFSHKKMIKSLLLDQSIIAGLGNIYVDESLYDAGIHPRTISCDIKREYAEKLHASIQKILKSAIKAGGSSIRDFVSENGDAGYFQIEHKIYGKAGQECLRCGSIIEKIKVGSRTSSICVNCQPPPLPKSSPDVYRDCWWGQ